MRGWYLAETTPLHHTGVTPTVHFKICPDPNVPEREPHRGWRRLANRWLRINFYRPIVVQIFPGGRLLCHPNNVGAVQEFLARRGDKYVVTPMLVATPLGDKH